MSQATRPPAMGAAGSGSPAIRPPGGHRYRGNPDAVRALVQGDRIHRDLYVDREIFDLEMAHLFANTWVYVGHDSQVPETGDYYTTTIGNQPVIMVRGDDGAVHVVVNRCAHKGARLVSEVHGSAGKMFRCPYHAWAYKLNGELMGIPLKQGYQGTGLDGCEAAKGLSRPAGVETYRGFVFAKLNPGGLSFRDYFGDSLSSIDNMVDRSPEGRLTVAGGVLRYMHDCNWKMFVENLNDAMHPMVAHESSAKVAKDLWARLGDKDAKPPMAIEQLSPFASSYRFFDDMGVRVWPNGHSHTGVKHSIHSGYSDIPGYEEQMIAAYGEDRARAILGEARHNTVYYPTLTIKGAIQAIRVARPIGPDRTLLESWTFRLEGAPDELLRRTVMYTRLINAPTSIVGHDDLHCYRAIQEGLQAGGNEWISLHRNHRPDEPVDREGVENGTSEISMRNQYRAWAKFMTQDMAAEGEDREAAE